MPPNHDHDTLVGAPDTDRDSEAGVVVYRATTYWAPLLFGGVVTALLTVDGRRP